MDKNFLIQLTNKLYKLTLFFPKKEPLRYKIRELADGILANCLRIIYPVRNRRFSNGANQYEDTNKDPGKTEAGSLLVLVEILDSFFEVARAQNWVKPEEILAIQKEYSKIREDLEKKEPLREKNLRHQKILEFLKENGRAQVWQLKQIFPEINKRTLRRDFEDLLKQDKIERIGERNETFYKLKEYG